MAVIRVSTVDESLPPLIRVQKKIYKTKVK
jgi:hypothetical protein